uniref:Protein shisa-5 n=1 Tax=Cyprinus carpio TaxID=7962 RepID=A0A8C1RUF2_CYPCA
MSFISLVFLLCLADDDCKSYFSSAGELKPSIECSFLQFCCGTCDNRYCCSNPLRKLSEDDQDDCFFNDYKSIAVGVTVAGIVILIIMFIVCCVCPCCCLYKMCRSPRPVMGATTTTVVTTQYPQQPVVQGGQYPPYQPMPPQAGYGGTPAYGGQPMQTGPYQGQPYAAGPPPPYQVAGKIIRPCTTGSPVRRSIQHKHMTLQQGRGREGCRGNPAQASSHPVLQPFSALVTDPLVRLAVQSGEGEGCGGGGGKAYRYICVYVCVYVCKSSFM